MSEGYDPRPVDMRPAISGQRAFQLEEKPAQAPAGVRAYPKPSVAYFAYRYALGAGVRLQASQSSIMVAGALVSNEPGGGDCYVSQTGVGPASFRLTPGAAVFIPVDDLSKIWTWNDAGGTVVGIMAAALP